MQKLEFNGIDWNERKTFIHIDQKIEMNFNELLKKSKPIFNNIYSRYKWIIPFTHIDDLWQECTIRCMQIFATPTPEQNANNADKILSIYGLIKTAYNYVALEYISKNKLRRFTISLDEEIYEDNHTTRIDTIKAQNDYYKFYEEILTAEEIAIVEYMLSEVPEEILASKINNFTEKLYNIELKLAKYFDIEYDKTRIQEYKFMCRPQICDPKKERQRLTDKKRNRTIEHLKFITWWKDQTETKRTMQAKKENAIDYKSKWREKVINAQKGISLKTAKE